MRTLLGDETNITVAQMLSNSSGMVGILDDAMYAPYLCQFALRCHRPAHLS